MVSMTDFLRTSDEDPESALDLSVPSPPKVLDRIQRVRQLQQEDEEMVRRHSGWRGISRSPSTMTRSPSIMSRVSSIRRSVRLSGDGLESMLQRSPSIASQTTVVHMPSAASQTLPMLRESSTEALLPGSMHARSGSQRTISMPSEASLHSLTPTPTHQAFHKRLSNGLGRSPSTLTHSPRIMSTISTRKSTGPAMGKHHYRHSSAAGPSAKTPFFHPSELEQLMKPLREEYIRTQTNELAQAKAAFEQLNQQLTSELPQLIDLR